MTHLSFYWLPHNKERLLKSLQSEFSQLIKQSLKTDSIVLPPIPEVVLKIQKLCTIESTGIPEVTECLIEDPGLTAVVIRVANSVIFNRRNITCTDLNTAVSRLGILRVRDITTAQAIEQLKHSLQLSDELNQLLIQSANISREFAAAMVLVVNAFHRIENDDSYEHLEPEKALLVGLLADIGLFCLVSEYHNYLERGNYLDYDLALQIFHNRCPHTSFKVLNTWGFDRDFIEVAANKQVSDEKHDVSYFDIARIAHHLLQLRQPEESRVECDVEINVDGAEVLLEISNLSDLEFNKQLSEIISASGL